ncbi:Family of unknown function (DUF500) domain containing protein [Naviculisporaceae sp. PSN 640]
MTSRTPKNPIPALGGFNPDYYAETASIAENISSSSNSRPSRPSREHNKYSSSNNGRPSSSSRPSRPSSSQATQQTSSNPSYSNPPPRPHSSSGAYQPRPPQPQQQYHAPQESGYGPNLGVPPPSYYAPPSGSPARPPSGPNQDNIPPQKPPRPSSSSSLSNDNSSSSLKTSLSERLHQWGVKAGAPINKLTNKLGSEAFWPSTMDQECDKAARILQSFCKDGFYKSPTISNSSKQEGGSQAAALVKIPPSVIRSAAGLAIFTTFRTGLHISGAGGSGVVVARLPSGQWSPPSGFLVHTLGAGLMVGLDIYDCVCVLRTREAVAAFMRPGRLSLGGELALAAGPIGLGTSVEAALGKDSKPVWSYMKSRGFYAGLQADGTVVIARPDANAAFYGARVTPEQILRGDVPRLSDKDRRDPKMWPEGARGLMEVLQIAEGKGPGGSSPAPIPTIARGIDVDYDDDSEYERRQRRRRERREDDFDASDRSRTRRERSGVSEHKERERANDGRYDRSRDRREKSRSRQSDGREDDYHEYDKGRGEKSRSGRSDRERRDRY